MSKKKEEFPLWTVENIKNRDLESLVFEHNKLNKKYDLLKIKSMVQETKIKNLEFDNKVKHDLLLEYEIKRVGKEGI